MYAEKCADYAQLQYEMRESLEKMAKLTAAQLEAFRQNDMIAFRRLEDALETATRLKSRAMSALRDHREEHGCQTR